LAILNNVDVGMLEQVTREAETDKSRVRRTQKIDGEWLVDTHGHSPWHFTDQASLDLNPVPLAISHTQ